MIHLCAGRPGAARRCGTGLHRALLQSVTGTSLAWEQILDSEQGPVNTHFVSCVASPIACSKLCNAAAGDSRRNPLMNKYTFMGRAIAVQAVVTPPLSTTST